MPARILSSPRAPGLGLYVLIRMLDVVSALLSPFQLFPVLLLVVIALLGFFIVPALTCCDPSWMHA